MTQYTLFQRALLSYHTLTHSYVSSASLQHRPPPYATPTTKAVTPHLRTVSGTSQGATTFVGRKLTVHATLIIPDKFLTEPQPTTPQKITSAFTAQNTITHASSSNNVVRTDRKRTASMYHPDYTPVKRLKGFPPDVQATGRHDTARTQSICPVNFKTGDDSVKLTSLTMRIPPQFASDEMVMKNLSKFFA